MRGTMPAIVALLVASACCSAAYTSIFFGEGSPGQPVGQHPDWPEGLADLLTRGGRVYSSSFGWIGGDQDCFYFSGDADDFNWFVEQWAQLKGVPRVLGLHPGREQATSIMSKQPVAWFDWKVTLTAHWAESGRNLQVSLDLWVGGQVELGKLNVPVGMEARASGKGKEFREIERFVVAHEAKRKKAEKTRPTIPGARSRPATEAGEGERPGPADIEPHP